MTARTLPHALDAERSVLGAALLDPGAHAELAALLRPADFFDPRHQAIWAACELLHETGRPVDVLTVADALAAAPRPVRLDGGPAAFLAQLTAAVVTVTNAPHHAGRVAQLARVRRLLEAAGAISAQGTRPIDDPEAFLAEAERSLSALSAASGGPQSHALRHVLGPTLEAIEERGRRRGVPGISTGLPALDEILGGLWLREQLVIAARPSKGKTALALSLVRAAASQDPPVPSLLFSLEMGRESLCERLLASESGVHASQLRNGWVRDWGGLRAAAGRLSAAPIEIVDDGDITLRQIRAQARRWRSRTKGRALVVLDYLQLVEGDDARKDRNREQEVARVSRGMKKLGGELDVATVVLSQLNRGSEHEKRRPVLSDLRESGAIEQDADAVVMLWDDPEDETRLEALVRKNRHGALAVAELRFDKGHMRFADWASGGLP